MTATAPVLDRLGDLLLQEGLVTREQLSSALSEQRSHGLRLGYVLVKQGAVNEVEVTRALARQLRMPAVDLSKFEPDTRVLRLIPGEMARKHIVLPLRREGRTLTVAMADPSDLSLLQDLKFITRFDVFPVIAGEFTLRALIEKHYEAGDQQQLADLLKDMEGLSDELEVVEDQERRLSPRRRSTTRR
jgi:type IV pilus assembly protein PilB